MANEHILANFVGPTDVVAAIMSPAFVGSAVGMPLVAKQMFPRDTNTIEFPKLDSVTAQTVSELGNFSHGASTELEDTSVTCTAEKKVMATVHSVESQRFKGSLAQVERFLREHSAALGRLFDANLKTLFSSVATQVTATTTLNKDVFIDARYNIESSMLDAFSGQLVAMVDHKGLSEVQKELTDTVAPWVTQTQDLGILGITAPQAPKGEIMGVPTWAVSGLPTSGSDDVGCMWDRNYAFAAGVEGNAERVPFSYEVLFKGSQGVSYELTSWTFWKLVEWNDTAACGMLSDT